MKKLVLALLVFACGSEEEMAFPVDSEECQPYHETYSHSVTRCNEEVTNVFQLCNPRTLERETGCLDDLMLKQAEECFTENVCMTLADWE